MDARLMTAMLLPSTISRALALSILANRGCGTSSWRPPFSYTSSRSSSATARHDEHGMRTLMTAMGHADVPAGHRSPDSICSGHKTNVMDFQTELLRSMANMTMACS